MRLLIAVGLLVACGAPFVPVTVEMTDGRAFPDFGLFVIATKKLNPACTANCELGQALEVGGCSQLTFRRDGGGWLCEPDGGLYYPFQDLSAPDAGPLVSPSRNIAPGSNLELFMNTSEPSCRTNLTVPPSGMTIVAIRGADDTCTFATR